MKTIDLKTIDQKIEFAARKEIEAKIKENMLNGKKTRGGILEEKKVPIIDSAIKKNIALVLLGALVLAVMAVNLSMQSGVSDRMDKMQNTISLMSILGSGTAAVPQGNSGGAAPVLGASPADMQALPQRTSRRPARAAMLLLPPTNIRANKAPTMDIT